MQSVFPAATMLLMNSRHREISPEEQEMLNRRFLAKQKLIYEKFCRQLIKSIDTHEISIEHISDAVKTQSYTVVNFLLEYNSDRGFYYHLRFVLSTFHLQKVGNPIFNVWDKFIAECKENDPFRKM